MFKTKKLLGAGALTAAAALVLAGCAGSDGGNDGGGDASGGSVKIMVFGSLSQPPFALSQIKTAAEAAVAHVNANGGAGGAQIELVVCDDNMNPNDATACGRTAVEEGVAAVVGTFSLFGDAIVPQLEAAEIPYVMPIAISQLEVESDMTFAVMGAGAPSGVGMYLLEQQGCESVVMAATDNPQAHAGWEFYGSPVAQNLGMPAEMITYPLDETNFSAVAQQIADKTNCVIYGGGATDSAALITALQQIKPGMKHMPLSTVAFPESTLAQLGDNTEGILVPSTFYFPSTGEEAVTTAVEEMRAIDPNVSIDDPSLNAYSAVLTFAQAADKVDGELTGKAIAAVLADPSTTIDVGMFPAVNFSETFGFFPPTPRVAGSTFITYKAEGGQYVQDGDPVDVSGLLGF